MWQKLKNTFLGAVSFLKTGEVPPNTPERLKKKMEDMNHLSSKKFFIVFSSVVVLAVFYYSSVGMLFIIPRIPPEIITAYTTIFTKTTEILAIIIASYIGCQAAVDFKYQSSSEVNNDSESVNIKENKEIKIEEKKEVAHIGNAKEEDYEF